MSNCDNTNTVSQLPGRVDLEMVQGNDFTFSIDWNIDLTDYTFEAFIIPKNAESEIEITVTPINESLGTMVVTIGATDIQGLPPSTNEWYLNWTTPSPDSLVRTVLTGALKIRPK